MMADGAVDVAAALEVRGQLAGDLLRPAAVGGLEALADRLVQASSGRRRESLVDHLLVEHVAERVSRADRPVGPRAVAGDAEDILPPCEQVTDPFDELDVSQITPRRRGSGHGMGGKFRTGHAGRLEHAELVRGQPFQARLDDGAQPVRDRRAKSRGAAAQLPAVLAVDEHLLVDQVIDERHQEERSSLAAIDEQRPRARRGGVPRENARRDSWRSRPRTTRRAESRG